MSIGLSRPELKKALITVATTEADIARKAGCCRSLINSVMARRKRTPRLRRLIAEKLGMPYLQVWGEEDPGVDALPPGRRALSQSVDTSTDNAAAS